MSIEHPVENLMKSTMENLRDMIDVNTVIGDAVETKDGSYIIPISKVTFGFASGGSDFGNNCNTPTDKESKYPFGGGSGAGVTVKPVAFLVLREDAVRLLPVDQNNTYDRIVDSVPQILDMFKNFFNNDKNKAKNKNPNVEDNPCDDTDSSSNNIF
ncbi:GerW family sporulation protein [Clostridium sp. AL.422]|uniref:GerW family sporulation protein n=1 Tax=Clostridium TaxID=1485 RepID=UPI00293DD2C5|nr:MULTISPECIES: GerW family sporulation protein [unclassified Clostridium]MDV4152143.1 GerW family sporulation protein [Clostridium sp. AL.422]